LEEPPSVLEALDDAQQMFFKISQQANPASGKLIGDILSGVKSESSQPFLKELQEKQEFYQVNGPQDSGVTGVLSHFKDLDKMINGLGNSNLMILAARPAMGKTAFALNVAENVCFKGNVPVGVFSLEMSGEQLVHRIICSQSEVESSKIKSGSLNGIEFQRVVSAVNMMQSQVMVIDDQPGLKITDLRARARRMKESYGIGFLVIDYLQLITGSGSRAQENRQNEISEISRMLKNLARELNIPILCLSQLSRKVEERPGHRPMMSDLRESGSIEQDSDIVMFMLRREYYDPMDKPGMAEVIVAKNRHGGVGTVNLTYRKEIVQFANYTPIHNENYGAGEPEFDPAFSQFSP
jgi:replicative DNA helicase